MKGAALMRDAALLGAECLLATPRDQLPLADGPWAVAGARGPALAAALCAHEDDPDATARRLHSGLGLDPSAYWLVMLCVATELHPEAAAAVSLLTEDARVALPTPTVLARILRGLLGRPFVEVLAAVLDGGAAARAGLVEVLEPVPGLPRSQHGVRLRAPVLAALLAGVDPVGDDGDLTTRLVPPVRVTGYDPADVALADRLLTGGGVLFLRSVSRRAGRQFACDLASLRGVDALLVTAGDRPVMPTALARPRQHLLVLDLYDVAEQNDARPPPRWLDPARPELTPVVVVVATGADTGGQAGFDVPALRYPQARRIWASAVAAEDAAGLAARFRVGVEEARAAVGEARALSGADRPPDAATVATRLRAAGARRVGRHATVLAPAGGLSDLVVPHDLRRDLDCIVGWHETSARVRYDMGLFEDVALGRGLTCLFSGKPGTGKTFAARCLAADLGLNVYQIDLSQVVSKYIGDTAKALAAVFDEVEAGHGLLLFDEADALFGRRSEVRDAHDRYANIEVGYLLQRLESFEGVLVLTTNLRGNMDAAFVRRLRFVLEFPAPDVALRRQLWQRSLPGPAWLDTDPAVLDTLAERIPFTGGHIHNVGLAAAHLAAATASGRVLARHLVEATAQELRKAGRPADAAALGPLASHLPASAGKGGPV